ncbi:MAG: YihY/virulence factor BrkB family protein [Ruminococcaceae bacterium]|nr:YihY/virulence factor BrkB family protein [Oscillospiraceae bacterium]
MDLSSGKGWIRRVRAFLSWLAPLHISTHAAHACYFLILSVFPALVLFLSLLRYSGLQADNLVTLLQGFVPEALMPSARRLILSTYRNSSGAVISLSALTALWSAGRGLYGLLTGLNAVYRVEETRGYFHTRWLGVVYTFGFLLVLLLTLVLHVFGTELTRAWKGEFFLHFGQMRFFVLLLSQTGLFIAMYTVLPNRKNRIRDTLPGALLGSAGWLIFSDLFSIYVEHFSDYTNIYGSVYAVALSMLWLYFCICIVFYGGVLNHFLSRGK